MKRFIKPSAAWLSVLVCSLALTGCAARAGETGTPMALNEVRGYVLEKGYTEEDLQDGLLGWYCEDMRRAWGSPGGQLSGLRGDVWDISEDGSVQLIVYYDTDGYAKSLSIRRQKPAGA